MPAEDVADTDSAVFDDGETNSVDSPSKTQQLLPLALTTSSRSPIGILDSVSTTKQSTAADVTSVKTEESEGSTPSVSPPLTRNPHSAGAEDPLNLKDNTLADDSPVNGSTYSEGETHADPGRTSPFKAPIASSHSAVENGDAEADDTPLSLCVSKPAAEKDTQNSKRDDSTLSKENQASSKEELTIGPDSNKDANPSPALTPPVSPKAAPDAGEAAVPEEPQERDAALSKGKSQTSAPRDASPATEPEKGTPMEEGISIQEKPLENPEPPVAASAPQPPRPDKPYSCSQCGKAYASRSGLKVRY